jgi:ribosomal protein L9
MDRRHISLPGNAIKMVGVYDARIRVLEREFATVKVEVKALEA